MHKLAIHIDQWLVLGPIRFLLAGGANTLVTYSLYLILLTIVSYRVSYALTFAIGLLIAYCLNRLFVFNSHRGGYSVILLPLVYLVQYLVGAGTLYLWIEVLHQSERIGPLVAVVTTVPITYFMSKLAFESRK